jgi:hypothetical protein
METADGSSTPGFWKHSARFTNSFPGTGVVCVPKEEVITLASAIFVEEEVSVGLPAEAFWLVNFYERALIACSFLFIVIHAFICACYCSEKGQPIPQSVVMDQYQPQSLLPTSLTIAAEFLEALKPDCLKNDLAELGLL